MTDADLIFYQFSRSKVERGDFHHFLGLYAPDKLPAGRRVRQRQEIQAGLREALTDGEGY
ncbi:MAG: hypothetical protein ABSF95_12090 [Verrucomicrobiota bacterium]